MPTGENVVEDLNTGEKETSLNEDVGAAFDALNDEPEEKVTTAPAKEEQEGTPAEEKAKDEEKARRAAEQKRNREGKFAGGRRRIAGAQDGLKPGEQQALDPEKAAADAAAKAEQAKAPASFKAFAREDWAKTPPSVQAEVQRREKEVQTALQQAANARQYGDAISRTISPFEAMIRAEQAGRGEQYNPLRTIESLLGTAALLRTGTAQQKAQLVAKIVQDYGMGDRASLELLDAAVANALGGKAQPPQQQQVQQRPQEFRDPRVDQMIRAQQQQGQARVQQTVQQFAADPKHDLFPDVREMMGDLIEVAARRGLTMSLDDAYGKAILMHPDTAKIVEQRRQAESVRTVRAATSRSRVAASSLRPAPGTPAKKQDRNTNGNDLGNDIRAALEELEGD